ncbi:MAG TPA: thiamine pyrophosphate-dependent enzyme [Candidatus Dormibacteraeota bacterium]|nr:thiamine pyrophosphate-dependent enzyme [Candidatus Dormibacteraeota bacterium]
MSSVTSRLTDTALEQISGNFALVDTLRKWGIVFFSGVNGGGLIHVAKHLEPFLGLEQIGDGKPRMQTMGEYVAGFVPLGYYLASGRVAGCLTTTGAATKLGSSGITDAKLHNIPAVYVIALNSTLSIGLSPLQDVSEHGMNVIPQLRAELGEGCIVVEDISKLQSQLEQAQSILAESKPVAIAFHPDILSQQVHVDVPKLERPRGFDQVDADRFVNELPGLVRGRRVIIYAGAEAARCPGITKLTTELSELLSAPTVWSVNGANAISRDNPYGFGYISFGGNDVAMKLWRSVTADDIVISLGFDSGEYSLNLGSIAAGHVWHFTAWNEPYGHKDGDFRHRVTGDYRVVRGDIEQTLKEVLPRLKGKVGERPKVEVPRDLNTRTISREVRDGCVDAIDFYGELYRSWRPHSIGFDDVCTAYKDRQYVTQRPHPSIPFHTVHDGSAMGGAFGLGVGARAADPSLHTFVFSGDGCWRLYGGALAEAANIGMNLFIVNNGTYAIVDKGLEVVIPDVDKGRYHGRLGPIDFVAAAKAHGWDGFRLRPDLGNLDEILDACYAGSGRSILVDVPIDADQVIGLNPRLYNLTTDTYL